MDALCGVFTTLQDYMMQFAVLAAILGIFYFGMAYAASGIFPEMSGRVRQVPKQILIGFAILIAGPPVIIALAGAMGLSNAC